jgi:flagellar basal-body rod modification protein FlgD
MSIVATVENGQIVESASQSSLSNTSSTSSSSGTDKESFLQLLVAQMKYQDPLEPTSNTEYISQYAQFTQVEEMQNMASSMDLQRASQLVGQEVYIKTTSSSGNTSYVQGKVDYVVYENNKAYLSINESLYSIDDLDTVVDGEYLAAYNKAQTFVNSINKLPNVNGVDSSDLEDIDELEATYNAMSDYEKTFVASDVVSSLNKYIEKAKEVRLAAENASKNTEENADE